MLNTGYIIFAKILAMLLEKVAPALVHFDQEGFVNVRHAENHMRR